MEIPEYKKSFAVRICKRCDKWYKPTCKTQKNCEDCKKENRSPKSKKRLSTSRELERFYNKYKLK